MLLGHKKIFGEWNLLKLVACKKDYFPLPVLLNELRIARVEEMNNVVLLRSLSKGIIVRLSFGSKEDNRGVVALFYLV